ncbi:MAG: MauE/DoxX family redox-associated membrane protein [Acidobacteriota bacterium]
MTAGNRKLRWALLAGRLILAGIFIAAGYFKLREPWLQFAVSLNGFKILPDAALEPVAKILPWCELALGLAILSGIWLRWFSLLATLMLAVFFAVLVRSFALGLQVDCGCFGSGEALGPKTLVRDGLMLALALAVTRGAFALRAGSGKLPSGAVSNPLAAS